MLTYLEAHESNIQMLVRLKKGHMASASHDWSVKIWNYENKAGLALLATLKGHNHKVWDLCLLRNGDLASASWDRTVKIWNLTAIYSYPNSSVLIPVDF
jgi:WD40 repeat protein